MRRLTPSSSAGIGGLDHEVGFRLGTASSEEVEVGDTDETLEFARRAASELAPGRG
jgi:hypothetical protein